jgi:hypothetical protein
MATGAATIEGLKGKALEVEVMKAQTRALRRMTLQFAGGGFLDESEIASFESNIPSSINLADLAAPVDMNHAAGKDITQPTEAKLKTRKPKNTVALESPGQIPVQLSIPMGVIDAQGEIKPVPAATVPKEGTIVPEKGTVDSAFSEQQEVLKNISKALPLEPVIPEILNLPTAEQLKSYRERFAGYANKILPIDGKMVPTAGVGGISTKLRLFSTAFLGLSDVMKASPEQWESLLKFLDDKLASEGAEALAKYIDEKVTKV